MGLSRIDQRREKRNKMIMSIFISIIMVMSGFGIYLSSSQAHSTGFKEHGLKFSYDEQQRVYTTEINNKKLYFYRLPSEVQSVASDDLAATFLQDADAVAISFDPNMRDINLQAVDTLRYDFTESLDKVVISAITEKNNKFSAFPVIGCENATAEYPVIFFKESQSTSITVNGPCITINSNTTGFLQARDKLLYEYYDVYSK